MHWRLRSLLSILALAALGIAAAPAQTRPSSGPVSVTLLHFNDVYEIDTVEGGHAGGLSRVATEVERLKRTRVPLLVTLGGDYLSPSAIGTARLDGQPLAGRQMVDVLNAVGLQWATFGNHEFDVSEAAFHARLAEMKFALVSSNVTDAAGQPFEHTVPSAVVAMRAGARTLRIGLLGLTIDSTVKPWVKYAEPIAAARAQVAALRGRTDAIVALTHLALAEDAALVAAVPEIDLVLGGHEHENWEIRRGPRFTPIVKADANVRSLAVVTLTFGAAGARPAVSSRLQLIDDRVPKSARVEPVVRRWVTTAFNAFRADGFDPEHVVATTTEPLDGRESTVRNRPGKLSDLILAAMRREAGTVDVALLNGGSIRIDDVLPAGPVREYDVIRVLPFGGKLVKATFDGALLTSVLDAGVANQGSGGYLQRTGAAQTESGWTVQGRPIDPAGRYTVVLPDFLLTGGEARLGFLTRTNPMVHDVQDLRDIRLAVITQLAAR